MRGFSFGFASAFGLASGSTAALSAAATLLAAETNGLALDFTDDEFQPTLGFYGSARIKDVSTPANEYDSSPTKTASSLLTYTSPSPKLTLGPAGTYRYGAHNLCLQSQTFDNASWTKTNSTVSANAVAAPDGSTTADKIAEDTATGQHRVFQGISGLVIGATYTASVRAKAAERGYVGIQTDATSVTQGKWFDLAGTAVLGNINSAPTAASITDLGGGWKLCTITFVAAGTSGNVLINISTDGTTLSYAGSTGSGIYLWGAQIRRTPSDDTYLATTSAARYDIPYEWNTSGVLQGVLVEEARTNLCLYASDLTNAAWTKSNMTTAKTATGADGVASSATTLTATAGNATALQAITSTSAARITSCFIKRRTGTGNIDLTQDNGSTWTTVTVTSSWTRVELASVTSANPTVGIRIVTNADAVDVQYFQHSTGTFVTSPIETFGSTVTRAADDVSLATTAFPFSSSTGLAFIEFVPRATPQALLSGASNFLIYGFIGVAAAYDGTNIAQTTGAMTAGNTYKLASAYSAGSGLRVCRGGGTVASGSFDGSMSVSTLGFFIRPTVGQGTNGYLRKVMVLNRDAASNAELQTLTT